MQLERPELRMPPNYPRLVPALEADMMPWQQVTVSLLPSPFLNNTLPPT
jgi:hypothetical protein